MKIALGADHAGYQLKEEVKDVLERELHAQVTDFGTTNDQPADYPDYAQAVSNAVIKNKTVGILLCGSSQGVCLAANKFKGIRAVTPFSLKESRLAREHLDANIICLAGWHTHLHQATKMIEIFLTTPFSNAPRHLRRIKKIRTFER